MTQIFVYNAAQENVKRKPGDQRAAIIRTRRPLTGDTADGYNHLKSNEKKIEQKYTSSGV